MTDFDVAWNCLTRIAAAVDIDPDNYDSDDGFKESCEKMGHAIVKSLSSAPARYLTLYDAVNVMMAHLGADGQIDTQHPAVGDVMNALHEIDGGG